MIIFIGNIPAKTTPNQVHSFIRPTLKGFFFQTSGSIERIEIIKVVDKHSGNTDYHSLVTVDSKIAAQRLINNLNGKKLNSRKTLIREYCANRQAANDRRSLSQANEQIKEKRISERRRYDNIEILLCSSMQRQWVPY